MAIAVAGSGNWAYGPRRLDSTVDLSPSSLQQDSCHLKERDFSLGLDSAFHRASGTEKIGSSSGISGGWDHHHRPLAYGYHQNAFVGAGSEVEAAMGITGAVGLGVGAGQPLVTGTFGGQRLIVGSSGLGAGVVGQLTRGGGLNPQSFPREGVARGDDLVSFYGTHRAAQREEVAATGSRSGASFVAYVGGEVRLHAVIREEEGALHAANNPLSVATITGRRGDHEETAGEAVDEGRMRVMDVSSLEETTTQGVELLPGSIDTDRQHQIHLQKPDGLGGRSSVGGTACQDCGNQAKKDCAHQRCRTCCKSRGFECVTHVKSTWVPAIKRRERQQAEFSAMVAGQQPMPRSKRARTLAMAGLSNLNAISHTSNSTDTPPRSSDFNLHQEAKFKGTLPPEVHAPALFKCIRVTGVKDGQDEYAYQAVVKIGGHVFKGILYDQGVDKGILPSSVAELHFGGRSIPSSSALIDLAGIYGTPGSAFLGGKEIMGVHY